MTDDIKFGEIKETRTVDDNGSTETNKLTYLDGKVVWPSMMSYVKRIRVKNQQQETTEYLRFSDECSKHKDWVDTFAKLERTSHGDENGYYYFVRCWTEKRGQYEQ